YFECNWQFFNLITKVPLTILFFFFFYTPNFILKSWSSFKPFFFILNLIAACLFFEIYLSLIGLVYCYRSYLYYLFIICLFFIVILYSSFYFKKVCCLATFFK